MRVGPGQAVQPAVLAEAGIAQRGSDAAQIRLYRHVFGAPPGATGDVQSNRAFEDLWLRFVTSVTQIGRQDLLGPRPGPSSAFVHGAGRDFAAAALPRIDAAFGHRDLWNVIDQVATAELGGAANGARHRSMAQSGGAVLEWLWAHRDRLPDAVTDDRSLVDAAEQWLAVTATADGAVESFSEPHESPAQLRVWSHALFNALGGGGNALDPAEKCADAARTAPARLAAFFEGNAGTGKTLAAHWIATSLGRDVLRIDLARVVSKYIGETEKNLDRIFADAESAGAALLFDEADALLGKRTDVRDAHDRYANLEVNALLQRVGRYEGVAIVATNASAQIDPDLLRRANATVVTFPLPPR